MSYQYEGPHERRQPRPQVARRLTRAARRRRRHQEHAPRAEEQPLGKRAHERRRLLARQHLGQLGAVRRRRAGTVLRLDRDRDDAAARRRTSRPGPKAACAASADAGAGIEGAPARRSSLLGGAHGLHDHEHRVPVDGVADAFAGRGSGYCQSTLPEARSPAPPGWCRRLAAVAGVGGCARTPWTRIRARRRSRDLGRLASRASSTHPRCRRRDADRWPRRARGTRGGAAGHWPAGGPRARCARASADPTSAGIAGALVGAGRASGGRPARAARA